MTDPTHAERTRPWCHKCDGPQSLCERDADADVRKSRTTSDDGGECSGLPSGSDYARRDDETSAPSTTPAHAEMDREVRAELAMNQRIADALAKVYEAQGVEVERQYPTPWEFTTDSNAALEAAAKLLGTFKLWYSKASNQWYAQPLRVGQVGLERGADTPALAICKMLCAWLDEQEKQDDA